jgi:DNA-binding NarL/FixJ family response regulator
VTTSHEDGRVNRVWLCERESALSRGLERVLEESGLPFSFGGLLADDHTTASVGAGDVVLVDPEAVDGHERLRRLVMQYPAQRVVAFTYRSSTALVLKTLDLGCAGYLDKAMTPEALVRSLQHLFEGAHVVEGEAVARLTTLPCSEQRYWPGAERGLTRRESQVLTGLGRGWTNREIAADLVLGEETVRTHLRTLYQKLGVRDRAGAVALALREKILD